ncbi:MAG: sulfotransferase [Bacteroidales bacterium]|nr:sulfotransferase [Bacteroidales bacterium]MCF8402908.1 sulfotransferase [Bacteroidales bacterium]
MIKLSPALRNILGTHGQIEATKPRMPIFVLGSMRSGTTLLVNKISQHPQLLKIGSELNEIWTEIGGADCMDNCSYKDAGDSRYEFAYNMNSYFFRFVQESKSVKRHLMRSLNWLQMQQGRITYDWDNLIPVNKSPHLMNKINYVHTMFPQSKFIFIIRDIFAHSSSMKAHFDEYYKQNDKVYIFPEDEKACWSRSEPGEKPTDKLCYPPDFSLIPAMWIRLNHLVLNELIRLPKDQFLVLDYNDLVKNQEIVLRSIFEFLELEEKHQKKVDNICKKITKFKNTNTIGDSLEKWKKYLSDKEKNTINNIISERNAEFDSIQKILQEVKVKPD